MTVATNRVSGAGLWPMTVGHTVMILRNPDLPKVLEEITLEVPAGHEIILELPAGHEIVLEVAPG